MKRNGEKIWIQEKGLANEKMLKSLVTGAMQTGTTVRCCLLLATRATMKHQQNEVLMRMEGN